MARPEPPGAEADKVPKPKPKPKPETEPGDLSRTQTPRTARGHRVTAAALAQDEASVSEVGIPMSVPREVRPPHKVEPGGRKWPHLRSRQSPPRPRRGRSAAPRAAARSCTWCSARPRPRPPDRPAPTRAAPRPAGGRRRRAPCRGCRFAWNLCRPAAAGRWATRRSLFFVRLPRALPQLISLPVCGARAGGRGAAGALTRRGAGLCSLVADDLLDEPA